MIRHFKNDKRNKTNSDHFLVSDSFQNLDKIKKVGINLAILTRSIDTTLQKFIQNMDLSIFPEIRTSFYSYECPIILKTLLKDTTADAEGIDLFINDLTDIIQKFCAIVNSELVRFRLQVIDNDMCRYFHCDYNNLRLLTTYRGSGTQWISNDNVNRNGLGSQNNEKIVIDPSDIYELETFWIGIFKGELFVNNSGNGIVHRSPSLTDKSKKRLLLRLDA